MTDAWAGEDNIPNPFKQMRVGDCIENVSSARRALACNVGKGSNNNDNVAAPEPSAGNNNASADGDAVGDGLGDVNTVWEFLCEVGIPAKTANDVAGLKSAVVFAAVSIYKQFQYYWIATVQLSRSWTLKLSFFSRFFSNLCCFPY